MIDKAVVQKLVEEKLDDRMFIVEIGVSERNFIHVVVDSFDGLTIDQCVMMSRHVEHSFDREEEDFELQVSSPGLSEKFRVTEQYVKYIGKGVEIVTAGNVELNGIITEATTEGIVLETSEKEKVDGSRKKILVVKQHNLKYDEIVSAKAVISFK